MNRHSFWAQSEHVISLLVTISLLLLTGMTSEQAAANYVVVDTGQNDCYDDAVAVICPAPSAAFYGQDAHYTGNVPDYINNGDGTVIDLNTGLMWQQTYSGKMTWESALAGASTFNLAGHNDWRLPTIKEL